MPANIHLQTNTIIKIERRLSLPGEILVAPGQAVMSTTIVGEAILPGEFKLIDVSEVLGRKNENFAEIIQKAENNHVEEGEILAESGGKISLFKRKCQAPIAGQIKAVVGPWILIESAPRMENIVALINGQVAEILNNQTVIIETSGCIIQSACSLGGAGYGSLKLVAENPMENITVEMISVLDRQVIIMGGASIDEMAIRRAEEAGVAGIIVGSIDATLLNLDPLPQIPIMVTTSFGETPMPAEILAFLQTKLEQEVCLIPGQTIPNTPLHISSQIIIPD